MFNSGGHFRFEWARVDDQDNDVDDDGDVDGHGDEDIGRLHSAPEIETGCCCSILLLLLLFRLQLGESVPRLAEMTRQD